MYKGGWAYGLTTVPQRRKTLLPRTLASLREAGFPSPVLFVDGCTHQEAISYEEEFGLPVVNHYPFLRTFGNWALGLAELSIRNPNVDRYAMFQDDFVCSRNMKGYLDHSPFPDGKEGRPKGYWNLYTFIENQGRFPRDQTVRKEQPVGWIESNQRGLGAVALVFNREGVWDLLSERGHIVTRPSHPNDRAWTNVDGGVVKAMHRWGRREYVHNPSLVQHVGLLSVMGSNRHRSAVSFRGEDYDLLQLLKR